MNSCKKIKHLISISSTEIKSVFKRYGVYVYLNINLSHPGAPPLTHKSTYFFKKCLFMRSTKIINDKLIRLADINYAPGCEFLAIFLHQYACVSVKCIVSMSLMLIIFKCYKNRLNLLICRVPNIVLALHNVPYIL